MPAQVTRAANIGNPTETIEVWPAPHELPPALQPLPLPTFAPSTPTEAPVLVPA